MLYVAKDARDVRQALEEAVAAGAELQGAELQGAELQYAKLQYAKLQGAELQYAKLQYAELQYAKLQGAELQYAELQGAELQYAKLQGAELQYAKLQGAELQGADEPGSPLSVIRQDFWSILDQAPAEAAGLRAAIVEGRIEGSTYEGECSCLVGTIANVRGEELADLEAIGIRPDISRPAEQWFVDIHKGDRPLTADAEDAQPTEGMFRATLALQWLDEWVVSRRAIATALAGQVA